MEQKKYVFRCLRFVGKKAAPVLSHKLFIFIIVGFAVLLYVPSLFNGFHTDDYTHLLTFRPDIVQKMGLADAGIYQNKCDLYAFSGINSDNIGILKDKGYEPWWGSRDIRLNFFRPLTSLDLALDYTLWPDNPFIIHVHTLFWFLILLLLVYHLFILLTGNTTLAALACLFFCLDDVHMSVAFIANRHSVIAAVFSVAAFICFIMFHKNKKSVFIFSSYLLFTLGLLASEMGITIGAFIFSYSLFIDIDDEKLKKKIMRLIPFVLIVIVWRVIYMVSGYGVTDQMLYVDPINNPLEFLRAMCIRFPILLFSSFFLPIADLLLISSPAGHISLALFALSGLIVMAIVLFPFVRRKKIHVFWLSAVILSIIPLCAGLPSNRMLVYTSIGVMGFFVMLLQQITGLVRQDGHKNEISLFHRISISLCIPFVLFVYCVLNPLVVISTPSAMQQGKVIRGKMVDFGNDESLKEKTLIIVKQPAASPLIAGLTERAFTDAPMPSYIRLLSSNMRSLTMERPGSNSLLIAPEGGYNPLPSGHVNPETGKIENFHISIVNEWTDTFFYNPHSPWKQGDVIDMTGVSIKVMDVTKDGRISRALFHFEKPLEVDDYKWIIWDPEKTVYVTFTLPDIGEEVKL